MCEKYISDMSDKPDSESEKSEIVEIPYRACPGCNKDYPLNEQNFYKHLSSKSGFLRKCKSCHNNMHKITAKPHKKDAELDENLNEKLQKIKDEIIQKRKEMIKIRSQKIKIAKEKMT